MRYKVGDRVKIKSLDWYNENKTIHGDIWLDNAVFVGGQSLYCGCELTIRLVTNDSYYVIENDYYWTDDMIEGLVEEEIDFEKMYMESEKRYEEEYSKGEYCHEQSFKWGFQEGYDYAHENEKLEINLKNGYQFKDENGNVINATKIVLEKKDNGYPKTYKECCDVLDWNHRDYDRVGYKSELLCKLQVLLLCRDAYWKIAGEEMGLDGSWEPNVNEDCFVITRSYGEIVLFEGFGDSELFEFPTREMRDAFKENFDKELEFCKELL